MLRSHQHVSQILNRASLGLIPSTLALLIAGFVLQLPLMFNIMCKKQLTWQSLRVELPTSISQKMQVCPSQWVPHRVRSIGPLLLTEYESLVSMEFRLGVTRELNWVKAFGCVGLNSLFMVFPANISMPSPMNDSTFRSVNRKVKGDEYLSQITPQLMALIQMWWNLLSWLVLFFLLTMPRLSFFFFFLPPLQKYCRYFLQQKYLHLFSLFSGYLHFLLFHLLIGFS